MMREVHILDVPPAWLPPVMRNGWLISGPPEVVLEDADGDLCVVRRVSDDEEQ